MKVSVHFEVIKLPFFKLKFYLNNYKSDIYIKNIVPFFLG
jgi:hypothetical protein